MKTLRQLPIGAKFADAGRPNIIFRVGGRDLPGYPGTIGVADNILKQGCVDAREPTNPDGVCARWGNNHYPTSNAHQWLNADGADWFRSAHEYDAAPVADNTYNGDNPYAGDPGFLTGFSGAFKTALTETDIKTCDAANGETETTKARVWLLSATEVGFDADGDDGTFLPLFDDFRMKVAAPTPEAVKGASWTPEDFNPTAGWHWWLRSPVAMSPHAVRSVNGCGAEADSYAYGGDFGLRPALLLKSDILVSETPDEHGVYLIG